MTFRTGSFSWLIGFLAILAPLRAVQADCFRLDQWIRSNQSRIKSHTLASFIPQGGESDVSPRFRRDQVNSAFGFGEGAIRGLWKRGEKVEQDGCHTVRVKNSRGKLLREFIVQSSSSNGMSLVPLGDAQVVTIDLLSHSSEGFLEVSEKRRSAQVHVCGDKRLVEEQAHIIDTQLRAAKRLSEFPEFAEKRAFYDYLKNKGLDGDADACKDRAKDLVSEADYRERQSQELKRRLELRESLKRDREQKAVAKLKTSRMALAHPAKLGHFKESLSVCFDKEVESEIKKVFARYSGGKPMFFASQDDKPLRNLFHYFRQWTTGGYMSRSLYDRIDPKNYVNDAGTGLLDVESPDEAEILSQERPNRAGQFHLLGLMTTEDKSTEILFKTEASGFLVLNVRQEGKAPFDVKVPFVVPSYLEKDSKVQTIDHIVRLPESLTIHALHWDRPAQEQPLEDHLKGLARSADQYQKCLVGRLRASKPHAAPCSN